MPVFNPPVPPNPQHITPTLVAVTPYLWRVRLAYDGVDSQSITFLNADLVTPDGLFSMAKGPLRSLWEIAGLTLAQAVDRCLEGARNRIYTIARDTFPVIAIDVTVDGAGRPQLFCNFPIKDFPITVDLTLEFRHAIGR